MWIMPVDSDARLLDQRTHGGRRRARLHWAGIILVVLLLIAAALLPTVVRIAHNIVRVPAHFLGAMLERIGVAANSAVEQAFQAVAESDAVKATLGEPLLLPAAEDVTWPERPADAAADELQFQFLVAGPRGAALVTATLRATDKLFEVSRLVITPLDGNECPHLPCTIRL
jgi:hypothetical protein